MIFIDEAVIPVIAGRGGDGCVAFRREKYIARGGPSGGDGGNGGSVWLVGDESRNTLYHLRFPGDLKAEKGNPGEGSNCTGRRGKDLEIPVPLGTQAFDETTDEMVGEIIEHEQRLLVAAGGRGGRGNARFATPTHQAPRRADRGGEGQERRLRLQLKLLADVGVVGLPNAGKSTLISTVSAAKPKIADYPFTTLVPQLGVVASASWTDSFVIADLPGLIAGAASGAGLGTRFLRHTERCRLLLHLVDLAPLEGSSAAQSLSTVEAELEAFNSDLLKRPRLIVGSKADAAQEDRRQELEAAARERGLPYFEISSATGQGIQELIWAVQERLREIPVGDGEEGSA